MGKEYNIYYIKSEQEIEKCPVLLVDCYPWPGKKKPKTWGRCGYMRGKGLYIFMECEESDPRREFTKLGDPVWKDSAMEAFFAFPKAGEPVENETCYINFEINANGAMFASSGSTRKDRRRITPEEYQKTEVKAEIFPDRWQLHFFITSEFLKEQCQVNLEEQDSVCYCNFYKISETPEIEHYGSFAPIDHPVPNFHLPSFFARARLTPRPEDEPEA